MKQGLQLRLSQQLTMTPQLQQAIRLLQLSTVELQQEIQQALESNPLLEQLDNLDEIPSPVSSSNEQQDSAEALEQRELPEELPLDASWDEIYAPSPFPEYSSPSSWSGDDLPVYQGETIQTLRDYLQWQADMAPFDDLQAAIAVAIIDAIDDTGYLTLPLSDIVDSIGADQMTLQAVEQVLQRIQLFDPVGVAARDLSECLRIQLGQLDDNTPFLD
ncbi:MAG: RNA polymerase factor sigma-54, partial [Enterobacteriaceae bacterium]